MATCEQKLRLAQLLRAVASGSVSALTALKTVSEWTDVPWGEPLLSGAYHQLTHFDADQDIRTANRKYAEKQVELLQHWASQLENSCSK